MQTRARGFKAVTLAIGAAMLVAACGGSDGSANLADEPEAVGTAAPEPTDPPATDAPEPEPTDPPATDAPEPEPTDPPATDAPGPGDDGVLDVPAEFTTITEAVDAAQPGDLVLIAPGTYNEAVNVVTDEIVIRGLEREGVVLDGQFELDNGIRVLGARGVAVENLTVQNYTDNGVFFTGVDGYRASYVTAYRNGDYGIYAFDSVTGQIEHSYGAGSPDAGFYIGQCYPCDAVVDNVISEHNGLGYSGTNAGGNLIIANSRFNNNRAGIVPNSGSYELCYPQRQNLIVGNTVYSNNQPDTPAIDVAILAMGNGILIPGGVGNTVERNLVYDHDRTGIGLVPFLEEGANDDIPEQSEWDTPCSEQRLEPPATEIPESLLWDSFDNVISDNVVSDSREADLAVEGVGQPTGELRNCWSGNTFATSAPAALETIAPCGTDAAAPDDAVWETEALNVLRWLGEVDSRPEPVDYETAPLPPLPDLDDMPDAATAPAQPATDVPFAIDTDAITTPVADG
ncbi:right-handed parallel beta-helix repeat-containing protein [Ilumatobacter coccineus]|uniref:Right handed beta helix domain-containing protein n=1 Tax=Ilumatobacter coccineus (strain NBRC 103263 / KCTC 29153 / YM16-304) TaxID=1313172 RepID=A0A6C7E689_ILUCY|nr:right-handed parallel beta-helix repeat-containing protein [Ilumatobacter coccineus]BAN01943.1 hypothetical protein YM304_16290 [Ilumatobacter coccineus YM16-304]